MITALKTKLFPTRGKDVNALTAKASTNNMGILDHIEKIVEISKEHGIDGCLDRGQTHLDYITRRLGVRGCLTSPSFKQQRNESHSSHLQ